MDQPEHKHTVELDNTEIRTTEPRWFERGVKEASFIRALNPSFNRDGGRYNLPPVWDNIIKKRVKTERPKGVGGARHHRHAQHPLTSPGRQTDEASSSW